MVVVSCGSIAAILLVGLSIGLTLWATGAFTDSTGVSNLSAVNEQPAEIQHHDDRAEATAAHDGAVAAMIDAELVAKDADQSESSNDDADSDPGSALKNTAKPVAPLAQRPQTQGDADSPPNDAAVPPKVLKADEQKEREQQLSALDARMDKKLRELEEQLAEAQENGAELFKEFNAFSPKTRNSKSKAVAKVRGELAEVDENIATLIRQRKEAVDEHEQLRRGIFAKFPTQKDPKLIQKNGRWHTEQEYAAVKQAEMLEEAFENRRANGQRLADWAWQSLAQNYDFSASATAIVPIRESKVRFVSPKLQTAYAVQPNKNEVEVLPVSNDLEHDDSFCYDIEYTNGLGQVIRKKGYVEIGYDKTGTAQLLGVVVPFLDNPLNGQMAATRSSMDEAIGKAFGK